MTMTRCKIHPDVEPVCPSCWAARGGAATKGVTSEAKAAASRRNAAKAARSRKLPKHSKSMHAFVRDSRFLQRLKGCKGCEARLLSQ